MTAALWTVVTVLSVLVILLAVLVVGLLRRAAPILERAEQLLAAGATGGANVLEGLPTGSQFAPFVVHDVAGRPAVASDILAAPRTLVLLLSTHCEPCRSLSQEMGNQIWNTPAAQLVVIQTVDSDADPLPVCSDAQTYIQGAGQEASTAFGSNITPHAFVLDSHATVLAKAVPESLNHLRALATHLETTPTSTINNDGPRPNHNHAHEATFTLQIPPSTPAEKASDTSRQPTRMR